MNHSYQIVTNEVDGEHIDVPYPNAQFEGLTYASAMLKANDAFKTWLAIY